MTISRRADYALRLIAALFESDGKPVPVREVAKAQQVPYAFARSIQHDLVLAGIVASRRGSRGGIVLAWPASELTVLDVIDAVQGTPAISACTGDEEFCSRTSACAFHGLWAGADALMRDYLSRYSIAELLEHAPYHKGDGLVCGKGTPSAQPASAGDADGQA